MGAFEFSELMATAGFAAIMLTWRLIQQVRITFKEQLNQAKESLERDAKKAQAQAESKARELSLIKQQLDKSVVSHSELKERFERLNADYDEQVNALRKEVESEREKQQALREQLDALQTVTLELTGKLESARGRIDELQASYDTMSEKARSFETQARLEQAKREAMLEALEKMNIRMSINESEETQ